MSGWNIAWKLRLADGLEVLCHVLAMRHQHIECLAINHRTDIGVQLPRIAKAQLLHGPLEQCCHARENIFLYTQNPQRRTTLPGAVERGRDHVIDYLLWQCGGIRDHRVQATRFRDEGNNRAAAIGQALVDCLCR